jgi:hypothetical protein
MANGSILAPSAKFARLSRERGTWPEVTPVTLCKNRKNRTASSSAGYSETGNTSVSESGARVHISRTQACFRYELPGSHAAQDGWPQYMPYVYKAHPLKL